MCLRRMKMNSLSLAPELSSQLGECKPGDSKSFMVTVTVDSKSKDGLSATVNNVEPYEHEEEDMEMDMSDKRAPAMRRALEEA